MSLLDHPEAKALLKDAQVTSGSVRGCQDRLQGFMQRYLPCFYREEQRELAAVVIAGKLSSIKRKNVGADCLPSRSRAQASAAFCGCRLMG